MLQDIYLDANATTPVLPTAQQAALQAMSLGFGNPSSTHGCGLRAKAQMEAVRAQASRLLGTGAGRLLFCSGATEGIQTAVLSALCGWREARARGEAVGSLLLYGATEHKAVPASLAHWNQLLGLGLTLQALPVLENGRHDLSALSALAPQAALVCTMAANNETGVISDLAGIERVLIETQSPARWLVDGVQALGKLALSLCDTRIDYAPFSGHKLYAPKGIGLLYVRAGSPFTPLMMGGDQEYDQRAGTENMPGIAALGAVLQAMQDGQTFASPERMRSYRERLAASLRQAFDGVVFNAPLDITLPTTLNFSVPGISSKQLLALFDAAHVRVSAGSACSSARTEPSYVLCAMGLPVWQTTSAVRLSFGALADDAFITQACQRIRRCGAAWRASAHQVEDAPNLLLGAEQTCDPALHVPAHSLDAFLAAHPEAALVDVREAFECAASLPICRSGKKAHNVPLSQLTQYAPRWLDTPQQPLVFLCRSGKRSLSALQHLRYLGHRQVWHLAGGLTALTTT